jgi:8-oxo-dGTP diphosphatase
VKKQIHVVGAVIVSKGKVLCVQRGPGGSLPGMWEFPGGKIEPGESPQDALKREIHEELRCDIAVGDEVTKTRHEYDFGVVHLTTFYCALMSGEPQLVEHAELVWNEPRDLRNLNWAPADIPAIGLIEWELGRP